MTNNNRSFNNYRQRIRNEEEQQALRQELEEQQAVRQEQEEQRDNAFRNDTRTLGGPPTRIRTGAFQEDGTITMPLRRDPTTSNNSIRMPLRRDPREPLPQQQPITLRQDAEAFNNFATRYIADANGFRGDPESFLDNLKPEMINLMERKRNSKVKLVLVCEMKQKNSSGEWVTKKVNFITKDFKIITENTNLDVLFQELIDELNDKVGDPESENGSGWIFSKVENVAIHTADWEPLHANSYIPLPKAISDKNAVINMKNKDNKCFLHCVARARYPTNTHPERIDKNLKSKEVEFNMDGIEYPVKIDDINKFENQNEDISVTVVGIDENNIVYPLRLSKYVYKRKLDVILLYIQKFVEVDDEIETISHYCLVNNISRLASKQRNDHNGKVHFCLRCFNGFHSHKILEKHLESCENHDVVRVIIPEPGSSVEFKNKQYEEKSFFNVYADLECMLKTVENCDQDPEKSSTTKTQLHEPISFVYNIVSKDEKVYESRQRGYTKEKPDDPDPMEMLVNYLEEDVKAIAKIPRAERILTEEDEKHFNNCKSCRLCSKPLKQNDYSKVRDHCYYTGRYRGAVHNKCLLKLKRKKL